MLVVTQRRVVIQHCIRLLLQQSATPKFDTQLHLCLHGNFPCQPAYTCETGLGKLYVS